MASLGRFDDVSVLQRAKTRWLAGAGQRYHRTHAQPDGRQMRVRRVARARRTRRARRATLFSSSQILKPSFLFHHASCFSNSPAKKKPSGCCTCFLVDEKLNTACNAGQLFDRCCMRVRHPASGSFLHGTIVGAEGVPPPQQPMTLTFRPRQDGTDST